MQNATLNQTTIHIYILRFDVDLTSSYTKLIFVSFASNFRFCSHGLVGTRQVQFNDQKGEGLPCET